MKDSQIIVSLAQRNLELQKEIDNLTIEYNDAVQARDNLKGWMDDMQKAMDYYGHPANMVSLIENLKDN